MIFRTVLYSTASTASTAMYGTQARFQVREAKKKGRNGEKAHAKCVVWDDYVQFPSVDFDGAIGPIAHAPLDDDAAGGRVQVHAPA